MSPSYIHYLGGESIHVCTLLYTHVYTVVYKRVHCSALGMSPVELLLTACREPSQSYSSGLMPRHTED